MPKVRYSNKAVEDLSSIWEYTFTKWSENQADEYYAMLISACNRLLYPSVISNRSYEEISEGLLGGYKTTSVALTAHTAVSDKIYFARCLCCTKRAEDSNNIGPSPE